MKREDWKALAVIAGFYAVLEIIGITCPIKYLSGVSCPGCGMSRAWLSLLRLDFPAAWRYHPLFWVPVPGAALLLWRRRIPKRTFQCCAGLLFGLLLAVYIARLLSPGDAVVIFCPREGLFWRIFSALFRARV